MDVLLYYGNRRKSKQRVSRIKRMCKNKFGSLDVGLIDIDEIKKLKKEDVMAMLKQAEHLQWKGPGEL